jgi:hypothetical protein
MRILLMNFFREKYTKNSETNLIVKFDVLISGEGGLCRSIGALKLLNHWMFRVYPLNIQWLGPFFSSSLTSIRVVYI